MSEPRRVLLFHTAFIGDIILTLPVVQALRSRWKDVYISFVAIPSSADALGNHPSVNEVIVYDKKGRDAGPRGVLKMVRLLRGKGFDTAVVPHRSLRSASIVRFSGIRRRIGFSNSAGAWLFSDRIPYEKTQHEIDRNLRLLSPLSIDASHRTLPRLYPSPVDAARVAELLGSSGHQNLIGVAPGSVWNTKRWEESGFVALGKLLIEQGYVIVLVGGRDDSDLCARIAGEIGHGTIDLSGKLTLLQSAEAIRRCDVLISNDSAPMHIGTAMGTPVVAIFGPTVPAFGFAPLGPRDLVVETQGLACRPCSIHGGAKCPIDTFDCMKKVTPGRVLETITKILRKEGKMDPSARRLS